MTDDELPSPTQAQLDAVMHRATAEAAVARQKAKLSPPAAPPVAKTDDDEEKAKPDDDDEPERDQRTRMMRPAASAGYRTR